MRNIPEQPASAAPPALMYVAGEDGRRRVVIDEVEYQELLALRAADAARKPTPSPPQVAALIAAGHTKVKAWRVHRGMKQIDLANAGGMSQGYMSLVEAGTKEPSRLAKHFLARALDVTPATL
jgi:DNA-binding XRE family transcriptional regulator